MIQSTLYCSDTFELSCLTSRCLLISIQIQFQTLFTVKIRYRIRCRHQSLQFHCDCLAMSWKCPIWFKWMWFNQTIKPQIVSSHYINYLYFALDFSVLEIVFEVKFWKISTKILIEVLVFWWKIFILCTVIELKIHLTSELSSVQLSTGVRTILYSYLYRMPTWRRAFNKLRFTFLVYMYFENFL